MNNFTYYNPTKIIFGENTIGKIAKEIPADARILITYGGGSIKKNGVYDQVMAALKNHKVFEFGGIEANPQYTTLMKAVEICRNENINFLGKGITVGSWYCTTQDTSYISQTVIDGGQNDSVVKFENEEDSSSVLSGFTITNGYADYPNQYGGGINCAQSSSPTLRNLVITLNCSNGWGGGISCRNGSNIYLESS